MKLAAMEGLYDGSCGQELVGIGILNPDKKPGDDLDPFLFHISIPKGLSLLATHTADGFVPGINDLINGIELTAEGDTVHTVSYAERIARGREAREALRDYDSALTESDTAAAAQALERLDGNFRYFGYGYLDSPDQAVPPVGITFYAFRLMVCIGGLLALVIAVMLISAYRRPGWLRHKWLLIVAMACIPLVYVCSQAGWVTAEVGRQPWIIQDLMPVQAAVSAVRSSTVMLTFVLFALIFTGFLAAEIGIMLRQISRGSKTDYESLND